MSWDYATYEYYVCATLLIFSMLGMGTTLTVRDFGNVARAPQGIFLIGLVQILVTPLLALGLARLFHLTPGVAVGLLLIVALPGGMFSNFFTFLGRGNVALSVSATSICTLGSLASTAFVLRVFGAAQLPANFTMPLGRILNEILVCLMLPLVVGMCVRRFAPTSSATFSKACIRASLVMLAMLIVGAASSGRLQLSVYGWRAVTALVVFGIVSMWVCYIGGYLLRLSLADSFTAAIEVCMRNANLGILLKASLFPAVAGASDAFGDGVLFAVLCYGGVSLIICGVEVTSRRKKVGIFSERKTDEEPVPVQQERVNEERKVA